AADADHDEGAGVGVNLEAAIAGCQRAEKADDERSNNVNEDGAPREARANHSDHDIGGPGARDTANGSPKGDVEIGQHQVSEVHKAEAPLACPAQFARAHKNTRHAAGSGHSPAASQPGWLAQRRLAFAILIHSLSPGAIATGFALDARATSMNISRA